jgi:hypothetical protein
MSRAVEMNPTSPIVQNSPEKISEALRERIEQRAYELYEARGSEPGHELEDWTKAESEILQRTKLHRAAQVSKDAPPYQRRVGRFCLRRASEKRKRMGSRRVASFEKSKNQPRIHSDNTEKNKSINRGAF